MLLLDVEFGFVLPFDDERLPYSARLQWALGDCWVHGEHKYGKRVKALRDCRFGTYAIQTLKNFGWVAKRVETSRTSGRSYLRPPRTRRRFARCPPKALVGRAARERLSVHRLRQSIKVAPLVRPPSKSRSSRRLARREQKSRPCGRMWKSWKRRVQAGRPRQTRPSARR